MRIRIGLGVLACCCAAVTACTAAPPKGPVSTVTSPAVGRPPAPASEGAALDSEAFTPYADLGVSANDGLAPGDTYSALGTACMDDAGYGQYAASAQFNARENRGLGFPQPYGPWGYIGLSQAEQSGFNVPEGGGSLLIGSPSSLPVAVQAAENKCQNIETDFNNAQFATSEAGIESMDNEIGGDVINDPRLLKAQGAWSACMARNGYAAVQATTIWQQYLRVFLQPGVATATPTSSQDKAQIAAAVTDADCTLSTDLGGIFFALQASYEQQLVNANQQSLNVAVREFKANYAKELDKLPSLLRTASAKLNLPGHFVKPSPTRS